MGWLCRHGHNEQDSPHATLPLTYGRIGQHPRVLDIYAERLHARGLTTPELLEEWQVPSRRLPCINIPYC